MKIYNRSHPNFIWSELIVEELRRNKIDTVCIAPGYRSAPLAVASACNKNIKKIVHYDERGLAFFALGMAAAGKTPSVVICTSGTAVANLFPAVVEASKKKLPLIVITADRPPELRKTGAHQTIDQA
ncbi:MAG: thiamine pyrophosphate-binding protein, partial [Endomicrobiales bacterium]